MKKIISLISLTVALPIFILAQSTELWVKNSDKGLFIEHTVSPKEGLYSLGRLYNIHPRHLAKYNSLDISKGLVLGQLIKIPLTDTNFNQQNNNGVPVVYKVGEKEGLFRVSTIHNKVSLENLRAWNNLNSDNVNFGTKLVVGYFVSKEMNVPPAVVIEKKVVEKPKPVAVKIEKAEVVKPVEVPPTELKKEENKPVEIKKEEIKPVETKQTETKVAVLPAVQKETSDPGFFKWHFEQQTKQQPVEKDETVTAGIFKTTSGWADAKYYLLIDGVQTGTIVKITNPATNKSVFAKVLGQMEGINLNKGLNIRISNAAASNLGVTEVDKFIVKVSY